MAAITISKELKDLKKKTITEVHLLENIIKRAFMNSEKMNKNRIFAKITGYSLLLMAIIAGFAFGFVLPKVFNSGQLDLVQSKLAGNLQLYK